MTPWILAVLALYFVQTFLPSAARAATGQPPQLDYIKGNRDHRPPAPKMASRMDRALRNMVEALPVFLTLALLIEIQGITSGLATSGAATFLAARIAYVPAYATGIPLLRSAVWTIGLVGIGLMIAALFA